MPRASRRPSPPHVRSRRPPNPCRANRCRPCISRPWPPRCRPRISRPWPPRCRPRISRPWPPRCRPCISRPWPPRCPPCIDLRSSHMHATGNHAVARGSTRSPRAQAAPSMPTPHRLCAGPSVSRSYVLDARVAPVTAPSMPPFARDLALDFGRVIRDVRMAYGWSQRELARRAATSQSVVSRIEAGKAAAFDLAVVGRLFETSASGSPLPSTCRRSR